MMETSKGGFTDLIVTTNLLMEGVIHNWKNEQVRSWVEIKHLYVCVCVRDVTDLLPRLQARKDYCKKCN